MFTGRLAQGEKKHCLLPKGKVLGHHTGPKFGCAPRALKGDDRKKRGFNLNLDTKRKSHNPERAVGRGGIRKKTRHPMRTKNQLRSFHPPLEKKPSRAQTFAGLVTAGILTPGNWEGEVAEKKESRRPGCAERINDRQKYWKTKRGKSSALSRQRKEKKGKQKKKRRRAREGSLEEAHKKKKKKKKKRLGRTRSVERAVRKKRAEEEETARRKKVLYFARLATAASHTG